MKPNNEHASGLVVGRSNRFGFVGRHKVFAWSLAVAILVLAGASVYLIFFHHKTQYVGGRRVYNVQPLTAEQKHEVTYVVRGDGVIQSVTADTVTVMPTGQTKPLVLKTNSSTAYSKNNIGLPADHSIAVPDHKVAYTYDQSNNLASALWVDYDKQQ